MNYTRSELFPGVWLTHLKNDKFKTACLSINLLTQLDRETASMNALIPFVLRRGTTQYDSMEKLSARFDELYGTDIEPVVRRIGEVQALGFFASFPEQSYLPGEELLLREVTELTAQLLLSPVTRGGLLLPSYVDSEKKKLADIIRSQVNNKRSYAIRRCIEEMCCYEAYSVDRYGTAEQCEEISYKKLTKQYRALVMKCPVEIFYCGCSEEKELKAALTEALATMPRGEIDYDVGTDVRMNAVEDHVRYVEEEMDVTQGKLAIGFRFGDCMEEPDVPALLVFNSVFGSGTGSKLFANVRERLQLCYYASSLCYYRKGILLAHSGISFDKFEAARDEILAQLEAIKNGEISDEELSIAKKSVSSDLRTTLDSQFDLESFWLGQTVDGTDCGPMEYAELAENVTKKQIIDIARGVECDLIYFLKGGGETEDAED